MKTNRRNFIKVSALAGGGFMMAISTPGAAALSRMLNNGQAELNSFLTIDADGNIVFKLTKHEMGQGSGTGLPMILADELGADWNRVSLVRSPFDPKFTSREMGTTGGSSTIAKMWDVLRTAGATAREMLKETAAARWQVDASTLQVANSEVINPATNERLSFGDLAEDAAKMTVPENPPLKKVDEFVYIGKPVKNLITKDVTRGKANYGINVEVEGMVYASIEKCPVYKGTLRDYDDTEARKVNGVIDIIAVPQMTGAVEDHFVQAGVAVIAKNTWSAIKARKRLRINWDYDTAGASLTELELRLTQKAEETEEAIFERGDYEGLKSEEGNEVFRATYDNPYQAHALMEPINATAHYTDDRCEVWVGTQSGERVSNEIIKLTDLPLDKIKVNVCNSGGSFGRRFYADSTMEAVFLSKELSLPVKVTWTREDEIEHDYFHPYQKSIFEAVISPQKEVLGWHSSITRTENYHSGSQQWEIPYYFPNVRTYFEFEPSIVHTGAWRSVAEHSSSLGRESFIDELAGKLDKDPLQFRLDLMSHEIEKIGTDSFADRVYSYETMLNSRFKEVLETVKSKGWYAKSSVPGKGVGLAVENFGATVCAHVAEVTIDNSTYNGFKVDRVRSVVHCGTVVNPHFGIGQIEGSIIFALSALQYGGVEIDGGRIKRSNFHDNRLVRMDETPEMEVHFVPSEEPPSGLGEPGTPPLAPAILNALYDATGVRVRKIPVLKKDLNVFQTTV